MPPLPIHLFEKRLPDLVQRIRRLVALESPTTDKARVNELGRTVEALMRQLGAQTRRFPQAHAGDHWLGTWGASPGGFLLMVHLDTVHSVGSLARSTRPARPDRLYGPGVLDMKASIAMALLALELLQQEKRMPGRRIRLLCTSDEETGSRTSAALIQDLARDSDLVCCLEPALPDGSLKTWRKGVGNFELTVRGKAAHAGANPGDGVNAIVQMSQLIQQLASIEDEEETTTITVGLIQGGTRSNVVPASCRAIVDARVQTLAEQSRVSQALSALKPADPAASLNVEGGWSRPPMPRDARMATTFQRAQAIAGQLGLEISEGGTGGASDANFVAPLGVPILDGLGAIGSGAHTEEEYIDLDSLPTRVALLAALLTEW